MVGRDIPAFGVALGRYPLALRYKNLSGLEVFVIVYTQPWCGRALFFAIYGA